MKTTGIVRRVDDLGRIVIPREYRRAYEIEIGDPMEISADENGIITLKRVDTGSEYKRAAQTAADFLYERMNVTALACNRRNIVAAAGRKKSEFEGAEIGVEIIDAVNSLSARSIVPEHAFGEQAAQFAECYISPVVCAHGAEGALIVMSENVFSDEQKRVIDLSARLIANNMQKY